MEKVIYLSFAQGNNIDGPLLAKNVSAVMIRAGQGNWEDPQFRYHYKICVDNHIPFGIWWFCQPNMAAQPQIDAFMLVWNSLPIKPSVIAYDVEEIDYTEKIVNDDGTTTYVKKKLFPPSRQFNHENVLHWCNQIHKLTGAKVGIYTRKFYFEAWTFETSDWYEFFMWIAAWYNYTGQVPPALPWKWPGYKIHQYEGGGEGTPGVDPVHTCKEYFNGSHAELLEFFNTKEEQVMPIYKSNVPMAERAWVLEVKGNQKVNIGFNTLGVDAIILPAVNSVWDGNHQTIQVEATFQDRAKQLSALNIPVFAKIQVDASIVSKEQHSMPELDKHSVWDNMVVSKMLDALHVGPWQVGNLTNNFIPVKALIFEQTETVGQGNVEIMALWQAYFFKYVVDHWRVLVNAKAVPDVPLILKTTPEFLQKYGVNTEYGIMLLDGRASWLYLDLAVQTLASTAVYPDLWSIYKFAPGDDFKFSYMPDGYTNRTLLFEFSSGKQKVSGIADASGNPSPLALSKWCDTAVGMLEFLKVPPVNPTPTPDPTPVPLPKKTLEDMSLDLLVEVNSRNPHDGSLLSERMTFLKSQVEQIASYAAYFMEGV